jgi:hypothetical protein
MPGHCGFVEADPSHVFRDGPGSFFSNRPTTIAGSDLLSVNFECEGGFGSVGATELGKVRDQTLL